MEYEQSCWPIGGQVGERRNTRVAELRESAICRRQAAVEYHQLAQQCPLVGDRIVFGEIANRAFEAAKSFERRADEEEALSHR